jgi:CzcA family heavy metal efflux pump
MTWIVKIALERPLTFIVMALMILIFGPMAALRMPVDIFPNIGVPVIGVAFEYSGMSPSDMANRIMSVYERILSTTVNDVEHSESNSMAGIGITKVFFQPGTDIRTATAQVASVSQAIVRRMPTGTQPPLIITYNASTVPVLQLASSSRVLSEQQVLDLTQNTLRPQLTIVRGAAVPYPFGGRQREIMIDLDPQAMRSYGLSATDVQAALGAQNQITPVGTAKIGSFQYTVKLNNAAVTIDDLNNLPVKTVNGATIFMRDVGHVRDGFPAQQNVVHVDGARAVLTTIMKNGSASTLDVVQGVYDRLPLIRQQMPDSYKIVPITDQSVFVKAAIEGVVREGTIAAALTSLMILLFLGSWRSTVIIAISIPLSVLAALVALWATGETLNIMTLGGLALAVGILVDDATVTIENINWHLEHGRGVLDAIMDGARQIVQPAFVSLLCICIVFVPMFSLPGVSGYLFVPMAAAVVYALIGSFILSRTLVPTMAMYLLKPHDEEHHESKQGTMLARMQFRFEGAFAQFRESYRNLLALVMTRRRAFVAGFLALVLLSFALVPFLGSDFFPSVDAGQILLHVRPPVGTRIEDTTQLFARIEQDIRLVIPREELQAIVDNMGLPQSSINLIYGNSVQIWSQDGDVYVSLNARHHPSADYVRTLRAKLAADFPGTTFSFPPADIVSQILNFGTPAAIDLQVTGSNRVATEKYALSLLRQMKEIPGVADARMQQSNDYPQLDFKADRARIAQYGLTERDVTNAVGTALAGTSQSAPNFWVDPKTGVSYAIVSQTPEYRLNSLETLLSLPVTGANGQSHVLGALGSFSRTHQPALITHYNVLNAVDLYAATQDRDLGAVAADLQRLIDKNRRELPRGSTVALRGQVATMNTAFNGLFVGIALSIVLIYLLIVINFQSWLDPFVIITALPAALAGIVWMLFATRTTLSVPALTGAIMCMGVATANSILVVSFARERLAGHGDPVRAAVEAGVVRFRPVLMTALAMIIGMTPMALGLGEGGEQNAPLGRAVVGGLIFATIATLMFVPVVFSILHGRARARTTPAAAGEAYA